MPLILRSAKHGRVRGIVSPMRRSAISRWLRRTATAWLSTLVTAAAYAQLGAAPPVRLVDIVEVIDHDDQVDITGQFNCSVRYITHLPAS